LVANERISELTELTDIDDADIIPIVDVSAGVTKFATQTTVNSGSVRRLANQNRHMVQKNGITLNNHNSNGHSIVTHNGFVYSAAINSANQITLQKWQYTGQVLNRLESQATSLTISNTDDSHDHVAIGFDDADRMHIAYDMHTSALKMVRMPTANSVLGTPVSETPLVNSSNESTATYPSFMKRPSDGKLFFMFRKGSSGNGTVYLYVFDSGAGTWAAATGTSTDGLLVTSTDSGGDGTVNAYGYDPAFVGDVGTFKMVWRETTADTTNKNPFAFKYNFSTGAVTKMDGTSQTVPISTANCDTIVSKASGTSLSAAIQKRDFVIDGLGNTHLFILHTDSNSVQNLFYYKHTVGSGWDSGTQLTFRVSQTSEINTGVYPLLWGNRIFVFFWHLETTMYYQVIESDDLGATWSPPYTALTPMWNKHAWNINKEHWESNHEIMRMMQFEVTNNDTTVSHDFRSAFIEFWDPVNSSRKFEYSTEGIMSFNDILVRSIAGKICFFSDLDMERQRIKNMLMSPNGLTPSQITSNQNNYNPTDFASYGVIRLSSDASRNITGMVAPSPTGNVEKTLHNVGSFDIVLVNESASSSAANRFSSGADITIAPNQSVRIIYDGTASRWRSLSSTAAGGGLANVVEDTTPQLGGNLDFNSFKATGVPNPTANDEIVNKAYFDANTETVGGTKAARKVIARDATNTGNEWTLLTNDHLSGSAGITYANLQQVSATDRILGRDSSGAGVIEEITPAALRTMINVADGANAYTHPNHSGEITSTGDGAQVLDKTAITNRTQDRLPDLQKDRILTYDDSATGLKYVDLIDVIINTLGFKRGSVGVASNDTRFSNGWLSFPSPSGTETFSIDASGRYMNYQPAVSTDADGGLRATTTNTNRADSDPIIQFKIYVDNVANTRWFFGFQNSATAPTGDDPLASAHGVMFVKKAGAANLYIVSNNATTKSEVSVITTLANTTVYTIALRSRSAGTIWEYSIDGGAWTSVGAPLPTATTGLCWFAHIEVDSAITRNLRIYGIEGLSK